MNEYDTSTGAMPLDSSEDRDALLLRLQARGEETKAAIKQVADDVAKVKLQVEASDAGNLHIIGQQVELAAALKSNSEATERIDKATAGLVEFFEAMQGAFKVFNWVGKLAKPVSYIAGAVAGLLTAYAAWKALRP